MAKLEVARIILFVKDMDVMLSFYEDILGLPKLNSPDNSDEFISLDAGGINLSLHKIPDRYAKNINIKTPPSPRKDNPIKVAFRVIDVAEYRNKLKTLGVSMGKIYTAGTINFCDGTDPEGNIFQISNRP